MALGPRWERRLFAETDLRNFYPLLSRAEVVQLCGDVGEVGVAEESAHEVWQLLEAAEGADGLGA